MTEEKFMIEEKEYDVEREERNASALRRKKIYRIELLIFTIVPCDK